MKRIVAFLLLALLLTAVGGCGGSGAEGPQSATLMLDAEPNAVHIGIYAAKAEGFYRKAGVALTVEQPGESTDAPKLLAAGDTDFAVLDIHDLGIAREQGLDVVGLMPIAHRSLASVMTHFYGDIRRPRDLEGHTVAVTGLPSEAMVDAEVKADGGDPAKVRKVTIGTDVVRALATRKFDAVTGFWNAEGVELERMNVPLRRFVADRFGAPKYPELVLATSQDLLESDPDLVEAVVGATMRGYEFAGLQSTKAMQDLLAANPSLDELEQGERLTVVAYSIHASQFQPSILREWAAWDLENGILKRPLDIQAAFDLKN
jgi:putative hydroxymethylpyrimidine transport system substrate-binding protein